MRNIQQLAAMHARQNRVNGLPCGEHTYTDPLSIKNRYQSEAGAIFEKYGTKANWYAWERVTVTERATGRTVFDNEIKSITGAPLTGTPAEVTALLDQSIYEVITK